MGASSHDSLSSLVQLWHHQFRHFSPIPHPTFLTKTLPPPLLIPMASPPPPELIPDAVAEILLRLTPEDPAGLVRASAVCKPWLRTLTDPAFLRRYRAFHGTSRVLGFLHNPIDRRRERFVPTTALRPHAAAHRTCVVIDCRHGRALLYDYGSGEFVVWDPVTGRERRIPDEAPDVCTHHSVLCAAGPGCDHSTCGGGPFLLPTGQCGRALRRYL